MEETLKLIDTNAEFVITIYDESNVLEFVIYD